MCNNMDGPSGHYAKWNKMEREKQILYITCEILEGEKK